MNEDITFYKFFLFDIVENKYILLFLYMMQNGIGGCFNQRLIISEKVIKKHIRGHFLVGETNILVLRLLPVKLKKYLCHSQDFYMNKLLLV